MRKILFLVIGWLITLSMHAQYNYFDHIEELDSIGKNWIKDVKIDYGIWSQDSVIWVLEYGKKELTKEDVQKLKTVFLQGMAKSSESSHGESHLNGRDSIRIISSTSTDIPQEASFQVMGKHVYGPCQLQSWFDTDTKDGYGYIACLFIQREPLFEHVEASTLRMDQTIAAILEETEPKVYEAVFFNGSQKDGFKFLLPGVEDEHIKHTQATIYEFAHHTKNKEWYDRLVATAYAHLDYREKFWIEQYSDDYRVTICVENPQKRGYIAWMVKFNGRLFVCRAEGEEGFCNVDEWYEDSFLRTQKVIHPQTNQSTSRK